MRPHPFASLFLAAALALAPDLPAQPPAQLNYQGRVAVDGVNFDGVGQFKFALTNADGSVTHWSNDGTSSAGSEPGTAVSLAVVKGLYSVALGDLAIAGMTAVPTNVFAQANLRLRVWFNDGLHGFQLLTPDQPLTAAGYAVLAGNVPDGSISGPKLAPGAVGSANLAPGVLATPLTVNASYPILTSNTSVSVTNGQTQSLLLPSSANAGDLLQIQAAGAGGWVAASWLPRGPVRAWKGLGLSTDGLVRVGVASGGPIQLSSDGGLTWVDRAEARAWRAVSVAAAGQRMLACAYDEFNGGIFTSSDGGTTWIERNFNPGSLHFSAAAISGNGLRMFVAHDHGGSGDYLYSSVDGGAGWNVRAGDARRRWSGVALSQTGTVVLACDNGVNAPGGRLYVSGNGGNSFSAREGNRRWTGVALSSSGTRMAAVVDGEPIFVSTDSGVSWVPRESARAWRSISMSADGQRLLAATADNFLYSSNDGGVTWVAELSDTPRPWSATALSPSGLQRLAAVDGGSLYGGDFSLSGAAGTQVTLRYGSDGTWQALTQPNVAAGAIGTAQLQANSVTSAQLASGTLPRVQAVSSTAVATASNTSYLATASEDTTFALPAAAQVGDTIQVSGGGGGWTAANPNWIARESARDWMAVAASLDGLKVYAAVNNDRVYASLDGGLNWTARGPVRPWKSIASSADGQRLVATSYQAPGGVILTSQDGGVTWAERSIPTDSWLATAASSADGLKLIVGADGFNTGGYLYLSADGGQTWTTRLNDAQRRWTEVASSADGTRLVAVDRGLYAGVGVPHAGQLYVSLDSGATWAPANAARDWAAVSCSQDGLKILAGVTNGYLYVSLDGGVTWQERASVSPWTSVRVSADGSTMYAVTSSGSSVFVSIDNGATWQAEGPGGAWRSVATSVDGKRAFVVGDNKQISSKGFSFAGGQGTSLTLQYLGGGLWQPAASAAVGTGVVGSAQLVAGAVGATQLADGSVTTAKLAIGAVGAAQLADGSVTTGKLAPGAIGSAQLADGAVTTAKLASAAVTANELANGAVSAAKLAAGAVGSAQVATGAIGTAQLADSAVTSAKLAAGAVGGTQLADNSITSTKLTNGSVLNGALATGAVTNSKISAGAVGTTQLADAAVGTTQLADAAVTSTKLAAGAVGGTQLADNSITSTKFTNGSVSNSALATGAVTAAKISAGAVGTTQLATSAVGTTQLADAAVTSPKLAAGAVGATQLANAAVGTAQLTDAGVTAAKLAAGAVGSAKLASDLTLDGTVSFTGTVLVDSNGTAGTGPTPGVLFGATGSGEAITSKRSNGTGQFGLNFFTNNVQRMTVTNSGNVGIGTNNPTLARLQVAGSVATSLSYGYLNSSGNTGTAGTSSVQLSIHASDRIAASEFNAFSDERIKTVRGISDGAGDLLTLQRIEVTDYTFKDRLARGDRPQKKVVAQQVERVFPQAVGRLTDVVPDIFRAATARADGWIDLGTDLRVGERVKLVTVQEQGVHEVLEVRPGAFRTAFRPTAEEARVFVYGREVSDFRTVDYEAISMLNVSATQELARQLESVRADLAALRRELDRRATPVANR